MRASTRVDHGQPAETQFSISIQFEYYRTISLLILNFMHSADHGYCSQARVGFSFSSWWAYQVARIQLTARVVLLGLTGEVGLLFEDWLPISWPSDISLVEVHKSVFEKRLTQNRVKAEGRKYWLGAVRFVRLWKWCDYGVGCMVGMD